MREPTMDLGSESVPFSQAPVIFLRAVIASPSIVGGVTYEFYPDEDRDFHRRYAAILLRERGL